MAQMKAVIINEAQELVVAEVPKPSPRPHDLIVKVLAVSVNPVDVKVRKGYRPGGSEGFGPKIVGYDGVGDVVELGTEAKLFKVGDRVYFAGAINRPGCNAEYVAIDERIVGKAPATLHDNPEKAAAIPLCGLTAWEGLTEQLMLKPGEDYSSKSILVVAGAGGVGSIVLPLAKKVLKIGTVIATASRPETILYCLQNGADLTIDHRKNIKEQLTEKNFVNGVDYIFNCAETENNIEQLIEAVAPYGRIVNITAAKHPVDIDPLFRKRATLSFELMFARPIFGTEIEKQHEILTFLAELTDKGIIHDRTTAVLSLTKDLEKAHTQLASGSTIGKIVLTVDF